MTTPTEITPVVLAAVFTMAMGLIEVIKAGVRLLGARMNGKTDHNLLSEIRDYSRDTSIAWGRFETLFGEHCKQVESGLRDCAICGKKREREDE